MHLLSYIPLPTVLEIWRCSTWQLIASYEVVTWLTPCVRIDVDDALEMAEQTEV